MLAEDIARCVLAKFDALPAKRKPIQRSETTREWSVLSGIVVAKDGELACVALATGVKCLPASRLPGAMGIILHDQHAEILAIRAFNRFLLEQCALLAHSDRSEATHVRRVGPSEAISQPFTVVDDIKIYMYCSDAPCGDASMELVMRDQPDSTPWDIPAVDGAGMLHGRGYFSQLGVVRRKPARSDALLCYSKSCSDKLALKECLSLLNAQASLFIHPARAYLTAFVLPISQYENAATERAFGASGRMAKLKPEILDRWPAGYSFKPFDILTTSVEFDWSRRKTVNMQYKPSKMNAIWTPLFEEGVVGGLLHGRRRSDPNSGSTVCRKLMWRASKELANKLGDIGLIADFGADVYKTFKDGTRLSGRRQVKEDVLRDALPGWLPNARDDAFPLEFG